MNTARTAPFFVCISALALLAGCASSADGNDDSDIKKRTKPKAGMGALVLSPPAWYDAALFKTDVKFFMNSGERRDAVLAPGVQADLAPNSYSVYFRPRENFGYTQSSDGWTPLGFAWRKAGTMTAGTVWTVSPAGLRIELDRPLVWDRPVTLAKVAVASPGSVLMVDSNGRIKSHLEVGRQGYEFGQLALNQAEIGRGQKTANILLPAENYVIGGLPGAPQNVALQEGKLTTLSLKTHGIVVNLDAVDPAFPDVASQCAVISADGVKENVRALAKFKSAILPENLPVLVSAFGIDAPAVVAGNTKSFTLNRLELEDVEVTVAGGATQLIRGKARIEYKKAGQWRALACQGEFPTKTGIDLPDGDYRITSTATGPNGTVSNVEEISFP